MVLPLALFSYGAWLAYQTNQANAERQIDKSRDIVTEHALKIFEVVERSLAEIGEVVRDMPDERIVADEAALHQRLKAPDSFVGRNGIKGHDVPPDGKEAWRKVD